MRKQTKLEKNKAADQLYTKNLAFFRLNSEQIYQKFVNYRPENLTLAFDEAENVNVINCKTNRFVYPESPLSYAEKQVDHFLRSENAKVVKFFDPKVVKTDDYHHDKMMDSYVELYGDKLKPFIHPLNDEVIQQIIMVGIGSGLHIKELLSKKKVKNLVVLDSNLDALYLSFYFVDWGEIFSSVENIEIIIEDSEEGFFERLFVYFSNMGPFLLGKYYIYQHYQNPMLESLLDNFTFKLTSSNAFLGFYDDERVGLAHTIENTKLGIPFARKMLDMKSDYPVFVVGNGPSLDASIDFLKENQHKIIIISCGTTLGTLQKIGLKPDIHVEQERPLNTYHWLDKNTTDEFRKGVYFYALNTVYPDVLKLFDKDKSGICIKPNDTGMVYLNYSLDQGHSFTLADSANPTVSNFGLSLCAILGFKKVYLAGIDMGMKDLKHHHSKASSYYDDEKVNENTNEMFEKFQNIAIEGKNGSQVWTNSIYNASRLRIEAFIEKYKLEVFNLGDGALIKGADFIEFDDLAIPEPKLAKEDYLSDLHNLAFGLEGFSYFDPENMRKRVVRDVTQLDSKIKEMFSVDVVSESQLSELMMEFRLSFYQSKLSPITKALLKGSMELTLIAMVSVLAYGGRRDFSENYLKCRAVLFEFLDALKNDVDSRFFELDTYSNI